MRSYHTFPPVGPTRGRPWESSTASRSKRARWPTPSLSCAMPTMVQGEDVLSSGLKIVTLFIIVD